MTIAGIDLGTTNSLIAVWQENEAVIIPNALGDRLTPSVVGFNESGEILIGKAARERLITHPQHTAALFKRFMGTTKTFTLGEHAFRPEELSSFVLRALKEDAEAYLGETLNEVVISVPAYFNDAQRKATRIAGELAGLTVHRLINEPTAAAMAYGLHQQKDEVTILVFDLGGGTFDVSILEFFDGIMEVRSTAGDNFLGGEDFVLMLAKAFVQHHGMFMEQLAPADLSRLMENCEHAKRQLSVGHDTTLQTRIGDKALDWRVTRGVFEALCAPLLKRLSLPVERALLDARVKGRQIDEVVLIGGATRMPMVRTLVTRMFGRFPSMGINPDEAVGLGAGIMGGLKARDATLKEVVLTDVCPYSLGVEVARLRPDSGFQPGYFTPIMERGITVPASKQERFYTLHDNQAQVEVAIYQGEGRLVKDNIRLGHLTVPVPPVEAGKEAIDVRFTYTIDGILEVDVTVVSTGAKDNIIIEEAPGVLTPEQIRQRLTELAELKIHPRDKIENRTLLARGERFFQSRRFEKRQRIAEAMFDFETAIESQNSQKITKARKTLESLLSDLEENGVIE